MIRLYRSLSPLAEGRRLPRLLWKLQVVHFNVSCLYDGYGVLTDRRCSAITTRDAHLSFAVALLVILMVGLQLDESQRHEVQPGLLVNR